MFLKSTAIALTALALSPLANAQATRTWVSGVGDDVNPCSRTAPCKTFAGAISKTLAGGIINIIDSGGFGTVTITKSITIDGAGAHAGMLASATNGININGAGIKVTLRNLSIEGSPSTGLVGVNFLQGAQLSIENCRIFQFSGGSAMGIRVFLATAGEVMIKDTNITDGGTGIHLETSVGQLLVTLDNVRIENLANNGLETAGAGQVFAVIKRSIINHNNQDGVRANTPGSVLNIIDTSLSFNNGTSVNAAVSGARIRISGNTIVNNATGLGIAPGATIESDGSNRISGFSASAPPNATFTNQ
jgi:hypothetical protein